MREKKQDPNRPEELPQPAKAPDAPRRSIPDEPLKPSHAPEIKPGKENNPVETPLEVPQRDI